MGGSCGSIGQGPDTTNFCSDGIDDEYKLPGFCTVAGAAGNRHADEWCVKLGSPGEWERGSSEDSCHYDSCSPYKTEDSGCCKGCCGIIGKGTTCKRIGFNGDPAICCLNDFVSGSKGAGPEGCWSDAAMNNTCKPEHRDITSAVEADGISCSDAVFNFCTGADLETGDTSWINRWLDPTTGLPVEPAFGQPSCLYAILRNLHGVNPPDVNQAQSSGGLCLPSPDQDISSVGFTTAKRIVDGVFDRYSRDGFNIGTMPGFIGYNDFQNFIYSNICCQYPSLCQGALSNTCNIYTAQELSVNPSVANWCGCYLPDEEYDKYVNLYRINKQCTPTCNRLTSIPLTTGDNKAIVCDQDTCIVDNITINLISSNVSGGINISQMCGNCGSAVTFDSNGNVSNPGFGACNCVVENDTIDGINSKIGSINISTSCTGVSCTAFSDDLNRTVDVPCDGSGSSDPFTGVAEEEAEAEAAAARSRDIKIVLLIVAALVVIFIAFIIIKPNITPKKKGQIELKRVDGSSNIKTKP